MPEQTRRRTRAMPKSPAGAEAAPGNGAPPRPSPGPPLGELDFEDAYRRLPMCAEEYARYDGRIDIWDRATETALQVREGGPRHEHPSQRLAALAERIALVRGKPIACFGPMTLSLLDENGRRQRAMEADQTLYLNPERAKLDRQARMVVGEDNYPDVVLEVDNTTDIRRHKLRLYAAWGFPELWVEVPEASPRAKNRRGLALYLLRAGAYEETPESKAFPGWMAPDIHAALNETPLTERSHAILERVGAALGAREGTGPNDDPLLRSQRRQAAAEARAAELERRAIMVRTILASRRLPAAGDFPLHVSGFADASAQAVADAAMRCADAADFVALLRRARQRPRRPARVP